jgi:hypothetical protein
VSSDEKLRWGVIEPDAAPEGLPTLRERRRREGSMSEVGEGGRVEVGVTLATLERETGSKQSTRTVPAWSAWSTATKDSTRLTYRGEDGCGDVLFRTGIPAAHGLSSRPGVRWSSCRGTHPVPMLRFQWLPIRPTSIHSLIRLLLRQGRLDTARQRTAPLCSGFKVSLLAFSTWSFQHHPSANPEKSYRAAESSAPRTVRNTISTGRTRTRALMGLRG